MVDFPGYSLSGAVASFFFILLTMKQSVDFRVIGPAHPILARVGEDAQLTCQLLPKRTAVHMEVRWYRWEPSADVLFVYRDGAEVTEMQTEDYRGRVQWVEDDLAEGTVALKMYNIRPSDDGQYWCSFQEGNSRGETSLLIKVAGLGSAPHIHMEGSEEGEIQLVCTAEGWFPEPQVYWEDIRGQKLLTFSEYHIQDEDGLFYVEATLMVRNAPAEAVSCFIHNPILNEEKGSVISIPEKLQNELASLKVIGPSQPLLVRVGEDIQLTCYLSPKANAQSMEVRWVRSHRYPAVYVYMDGDHVSKEQMAEYKGRTALVTDALSEGRLTLHIRNTSISDDGQYRCLFEKDGVYQESSLDLKVVDHHGGAEGWRNAADVQLRRVVPAAPCAVEGHGRNDSSIIFRGPDSRQPWAVPCGDISVGPEQFCCELDMLHQQPPSWRGENGNFFFLRFQEDLFMEDPIYIWIASSCNCRPDKEKEL
ncbi:butyrophilin-like protein 2 isoform X3 [Pteronotus mesoamericanus]|uniref:butyrophilin-like protein 2 isoform X3 n=1 Tax=Pteronotus mesoamericanus TaxID=1884717 RepID=UPI0023EAAF6E|nr:butyrophilin-like protein 2 isoform X3 [Pteronotus parnellii mesoamericanus]